MHRELPLDPLLHQAKNIWRGSEILRGVLSILAIVLGLGLLFCWTDNLLHLNGVIRAVLSFVWVGAAVFLSWIWLVRPIRRPMPRSAIARALETTLGVTDNLFINAVQLHEQDAANRSNEMVRNIMKQAMHQTEKHALSGMWPKRRLLLLASAGAGAAMIWLVYGMLFAEHAKNALVRFMQPYAAPPPLAEMVFEVSPGDAAVKQGDLLDLVVHVRQRDPSRGKPPEDLTLHLEHRGHVRDLRLEVSKQGIAKYQFREVMEDFHYQLLAAGRAQSRKYLVRVRRPVPVENVRFTILPPDYVDAEPEIVHGAQELIRGLRGSRVHLSFASGRKVPGARLVLNGKQGVPLKKKDEIWQGEFQLVNSMEAAVFLEDDRSGDLPSLRFRVLPIFDQPPTVQWKDVESNQMIAPGEEVVLPVEAMDDWGVRQISIFINREGESENECKRWNYPLPGHKSSREIYRLRMSPSRFVPGETYRVRAAALDANPFTENRGVSQGVLLRIASVEEVALPQGDSLSALLERLKQLIRKQETATNRGQSLMVHYGDHRRKKTYHRNLNQVIRDQRGCKNFGQQLASEITGVRETRELGGRLTPIVQRDMPDILRKLAGSGSAGSYSTPPGVLEEAVQTQRKVLEALTALLGQVMSLAADEIGSGEDDVAAEDDGIPEDAREVLSELAEKLDDFREFQKKMIQDTQELEKISHEDWTEGDQRLLGELADQESEWAKFFQEAFTDLSKVPEQDFATSELLKELNQVYMEVQQAAEAVYEETMEIAVPHEQAGLELAEELEHNLERWIPDTPDYQKWVMEEPPEEFDVPLADLPEEMEDIIGDLLDEEESMSEDVEDISTSWMDSLDAGGGWDAAGGPISNMSAKGITSNRLPNQDEIGGRSGEGRTGKSHGQFVEETAEGKGGRDTPTRLTEDPYEEGSVKDMSNEQSSGATGGGKLAGQGLEGLEGQPPPDVAEKMERLAGNQQELRQRSEATARWLRAYHLPAGDLEEAIQEMEQMEQHLQKGRGFDLRASHNRIRRSLADSRKALQVQAAIHREHGANMPKWVRSEILSGTMEETPHGMEALLQAYYEAIAKGGRE